jgi:formylglycine-generating enzyme required for sulfatase activity
MKKFNVMLLITAGLLVMTSWIPFRADHYYLPMPKGYSFVPNGSHEIDGRIVTTEAFFISSTEISNFQYRVFLNDLKAKGDTASLRIARVDSLGWRDQKAYNEPYVEYYFWHPAYDTYPVVNISYEGALLYCKWLTEKAKQEYPNLKVMYRLPSREEWIVAARGGSSANLYSCGLRLYKPTKKTFWGCNFYNLGAESIHYNDTTGTYNVKRDGSASIEDLALLTAPVEMYQPNEYGIYNMSGNVSEMTDQKGIAVGGCWKSPGYDVRVTSIQTYTKACNSVGFRPVITYLAKE